MPATATKTLQVIAALILVIIASVAVSLLALYLTPGVEYVTGDWTGYMTGYIYIDSLTSPIPALGALFVTLFGGLYLVSAKFDL